MKNSRGPGQPDSQSDVINKYGTYEVQRTNGIENDFPQIAQGMSKETAKRRKQHFRNWYHHDLPS